MKYEPCGEVLQQASSGKEGDGGEEQQGQHGWPEIDAKRAKGVDHPESDHEPPGCPRNQKPVVLGDTLEAIKPAAHKAPNAGRHEEAPGNDDHCPHEVPHGDA